MAREHPHNQRSPVEEASHALRLCGAFLCRAQYTEPVTPYSRFVFGRDKGFHATPSGRGSLVYVGLVSRRGFRCPSYWRSSPGEKRHLPATQCELRSLLRLEC